MTKFTHIRSILLFIFTVQIVLSAHNSVAIERLFFKESTFAKFKYPNGVYDEQYTKILEAKVRKRFPRATLVKVASYLTTDDSREVVAYYAQLSGQRFFKENDRFFYVFSDINGQPASKIEIQPIPISALQKKLWPTKVDLIIVSYPIQVTNALNLNRTIDDLRKRVGRFCYEGELREDIAKIEMEDLGPDAEVFVISTRDPFTKVYRFFRRRYGRIRYLPARDGEIFTRDFEIDATRAVGLDRKKEVLYIRVEENPMITDNDGNSQVYIGYTFIQYTFWKNHD